MSMLSTILMPVAFSDRCRLAGRYAGAVAARFRSRLVLLHVVEPIAAYVSTEMMAYSAAGETTPQRVETARGQLESFFADEFAGRDVDRVVVAGAPSSEIVRHAHAARAGLILMPTHGYGPFRRFLLGSVTAKVMHDADCPVWTGPHLEEGPAPDSLGFARIACAVDLGPESGAVLAWAANFAREFGSALTVVHVLPAAATRVGGFSFDPDLEIQIENDARGRLASLLAEAGTEAEVAVEAGVVEDVVSGAAKRLRADLLVIGRGRRAGVLGRLRARAYAILRESPCPVAAV